MKKLDFNDGEVPEYEVRSNKQNTTNDNAVLAIESGFPTSVNVPGLTPGPVSKIAESGVYVDLSSPKAEMKNVTMQMQGSASGYGVVFNYVDAENYATIQYDGSKWIAGGKKNGQDVAVDLSAHNIPVIAPDDTRTVRIAKENGVYTLQMSGGAGTAAEEFETYDLGNLDGIYEGAGKVGVVVTEDMTLYVGAITTVYVLEGIEFPVPEEGIIKLESNEMKVLVGESFPSIYTYLNPEEEYLMGTGVTVGNENTNMDILTESGNVTCATESKLLNQTKDTATYEIKATGENVEAVFTVSLKVTEKILELSVDKVDVKSGVVRTFGFSDLPMAAVAGATSGAVMGIMNGWGPASDTFVDLKTVSAEKQYNDMTYALFYDKIAGVVAAVENNAENGEGKYVVKQDPKAPSLTVSNTDWAWQYYENSKPEKNPPFAKV